MDDGATHTHRRPFVLIRTQHFSTRSREFESVQLSVYFDNRNKKRVNVKKTHGYAYQAWYLYRLQLQIEIGDEWDWEWMQTFLSLSSNSPLIPFT